MFSAWILNSIIGQKWLKLIKFLKFWLRFQSMKKSLFLTDLNRVRLHLFWIHIIISHKTLAPYIDNTNLASKLRRPFNMIPYTTLDLFQLHWILKLCRKISIVCYWEIIITTSFKPMKKYLSLITGLLLFMAL